MKKILIRCAWVLLISVLIEVVVFQGANLWKLYSPAYEANQLFTLDEFETANWETNPDGSLKSMADPILVLPYGGKTIDTLRISAETSAPLTYIDLFYINDAHPQYGEMYQHCEPVSNNHVTAQIKDNVQNLRIDLGDDAGLTLTGLTVEINPVSIRLSLSRIVAMVLIYWGGVFLFSLQKMPDYHLDRMNTGGTKEKMGINHENEGT